MGNWPTPVRALSRLGAAFGCKSLYVKDDGLSGALYGGNKVRKLEFTIGKALAENAQAVLTFGAAGSHHALATTIYAQEHGLRSIVLLSDQPPSYRVSENLVRLKDFGAEIHYCPHFFRFDQEASRIAAREVEACGKEPFVIPAGGSSPEGTLGYVNAAFELGDQIDAGEIPAPDVIYLPLGTAGTAVGLVVGLRALGMQTRVECIRVVDKDYATHKRCMGLARQTVALLRVTDPSFPDVTITPEDFSIRHEFFGKDYGALTPEGSEAIFVMKKLESLTVERTYTAKAVAALIDDARTGWLRDKNALYWYTYNAVSLPEPSFESFHEMPVPLHRYFDTTAC